MIIITENKTQHYLIKNFLNDIGYYNVNESLGQHQAGEHTALDINALDMDNNDTIVDTPRHEIENKEIFNSKQNIGLNALKKAAIKKPKMNKLLRLFRNGYNIALMSAILFFNSGSQQQDFNALEQIAQDNRQEVQAVIDEKPNINNDQFNVENTESFEEEKLSLSNDEKDINKARIEREYDGKEITRRTHHSSVYNFEGFKSKPYPDAGGISIGYGIQLFSDANNKGGKTWQEVFYGEKLGLKIEGKGRNKYINKNGKKIRLIDIKNITESEGKLATDRDIPERIKLMYKVYPWSKDLPRDIQLALLDMTYNMGMWFGMSGFKGNLKASSECIVNGDFEMAIRYLNTSKQELKYHTTPEQISYEDSNETLKYSGYALQGDKALPAKGRSLHRRAINSLNRIDNGIEILNRHISNSNIEKNESYSIKNAYLHLFS